MYALRTLRMSATVAAAALAVGTLGAGAAYAGKPPPRPTNVTATAAGTSLSSTSTSYAVTASWNAVGNATSYKVSLTKGGQTLASGSVTTTGWTPTVTSTPGTATFTVRALAGRRQGKPASTPVTFGDVNAPTGSFTTSWDNNTAIATLTQTGLADDSGTGGVTRVVNWHDPEHPGTVNWTTGTTLDHTYPLHTAARYVPTVTLTDAATNHVDIDAPAVVIDDTEAPTGAAYSVDRASAWAAFTKVTVTETAAPSDIWSPEPFITRVVHWGDGTTSAVKNGTASHKYATAGDYTPQVTVSDEAHNSVVVPTTAVTVTADTVAPTLKLILPKAKHSVKAWRTLRGKATDAQTGVKSVWLKAVEKRGTVWFGYNAATQKWLKATSKAKAFARSKAFNLPTNARHRWAARLAGLAKGTLVYKVKATDNVGNHSRTVTHSATLTQR